MKYTVELTNLGTKFYYKKGTLHREDGPAIEYVNGDKEWWINGKRHREDGPAVENANGFKVWWINGKELTEEEFNKRTQNKENKFLQFNGKKYKLVETKQ